MNIALAASLMIVAISEAGCTAETTVTCRGVYRNVTSQVTEESSKAVLGFRVEKAGVLGKLISQKDWKGFVIVNYAADPYAELNTGGEVLQLNNDFGPYLSATGENPKDSKSLLYDPIDYVVKYEDQQGDVLKSFSGVCHPETAP